jgi:hypothetical protein
MKLSQYQPKSYQKEHKKKENQDFNFPDFSPTPKGKTNFSFLWLVGIFFALFLVSMVYVVYDENGKPDITPERKAALEKDLEKLENAEQYVLKASINGFYPCLSCLNPLDSIFLKKGEVYRYGVTTNGEKGRYRNSLKSKSLIYEPQFLGNYLDCLKQEKIKIYYYPTLPECLARETKLLRPAGNPQDR